VDLPTLGRPTMAIDKLMPTIVPGNGASGEGIISNESTCGYS
jgi:hypothetical protein